MLSFRLFNLLDHIGQRVRKNGHPFGGIQLVFCGDFYQLPPIGNEGDPDSSRFCFESPLWNHAFSNSNFETNQIPLKTIFRQKDHSFTKILNQIREGRLTKTPYNRGPMKLVALPESMNSPKIRLLNSGTGTAFATKTLVHD